MKSYFKVKFQLASFFQDKTHDTGGVKEQLVETKKSKAAVNDVEIVSNGNLEVKAAADTAKAADIAAELEDKIESPQEELPVIALKNEEVNSKAAAVALIGQKLNANVDFQKFSQNNLGLDLDVSKDIQNKIEKVESPSADASTIKIPVTVEEDDAPAGGGISSADYSQQSSFVTDFESFTAGDVIKDDDDDVTEDEQSEFIGQVYILDK